jgi:hypothetical protein
MSCMAGDGDILYGQRGLLTLVRADGIQSYLYFHIYTGLVALLDRIQLSFSIITISTHTAGAQHPSVIKPGSFNALVVAANPFASSDSNWLPHRTLDPPKHRVP